MSAPNLSRALPALALACLAACGGGGLQPPGPVPPPDDEAGGHGPIPQPEPEPEAPAAEIHFPPPVSQTDADAVSVRGVSEHLGETDQILVNGIVAQSDDGFATWSVDLPLEVGFNHIRVEAFAHAAGEGELLSTATVERLDLLLEILFDLAQGGEDHLALALDSRVTHEGSDRIVEIDMISGARRVVSQAGVRGEGFEFDSARGLVFEPIQGGQLYFMCDGGNLTPSIYRVEYASGNRYLHSGPEKGAGPLFEGPFVDMTIDEASGSLYVAMDFPARVYEVNWLSGDRTVISTLENDQGFPPLGDGSDAAPISLAWDHQRARILYTGYQESSSAHVLVEIDLGNGNRQVINANLPFGAPSRELCIPRDQGASAFLLTDDVVWELDFDSGGLQVSIPSDHPGPSYYWPTNMIVNRTGDQLVWIDRASNALVGGDPETGEATEVVGNAVGAGAPLSALGDVLAEEEALFATRGDNDLCEVELSSGGRSTISTLGFPICRVARGPLSRELYLISQDWPGHSLYRVDPEDAAVATISAPGGEEWNQPYSLAIDREERFAYVLLSERIERIDLETGERSIVPVDIEGDEPFSNLTYDGDSHRLLFVQESGGGILFELSLEDEELRAVGHFGASGCSGLAVDPDAGRALAITIPVSAHSGSQQLVSMDIEAGESTTLSSLQVGRGPALKDIMSMSLVPETGTVFVTQSDLRMILAIDSVSGDRVIVAR
jgi:hypothetical protein